MKTKLAQLLLVAGTTAGLAAAASAQPFVINISGATLFEDFFRAPASTNDYFDVDGDNDAAIDPFNSVDQLAPDVNVGVAFPSNLYWIVQYTGVGSGNGLADLVAYGQACIDGDATGPLDAGEVDFGLMNRDEFVNGGNLIGDSNPFHAYGYPFETETTSNVARPYTSLNDPNGCSTIDLAVLDVPVSWFVTTGVAADAAYEKNPGQQGYGLHPLVATGKDGSLTDTDSSTPGEQPQSNLLKSLGTLNLFNPPAIPDNNTVFDTAVAWVPIAALVNYGVGQENISKTDLRHLAATGRRNTGENLTKVTRDAGSGTRNGFMSGICLDPSWGAGENIGVKNNDADVFDVLGPQYLPSNKGGSSRMEGTSENTRLAVGHTGAERGLGRWLGDDSLDVLGVLNDIDNEAGTTPARPTIDNVLAFDDDGYTIGGPESFASIGDRRNETVPGGIPGNTNPAPSNPQAYAYVNNIVQSVAAIEADPTGDDTFFTPGEFLATEFILVAALDNFPSLVDPCDISVNPDFNLAVQDFVRSGSVLGNAQYATYNDNTCGLVPTRLANSATVAEDLNGDGVVNADPLTEAYTDGVAAGVNYVSQGGATVVYGDPLTERNCTAGDFNGDGLRDIDDAGELIAAWRDRNGGPAWIAPNGAGPIAGAPGTDAVIEILGDFDGDGNFTTEDVRYWADGLAIVPNSTPTVTWDLGDRAVDGVLDRFAGFVAVDAEFGGNFFGTTLATGAAYTDGASAADVAGDGQTPGWAPTGADGSVDASDLDYIYLQFVQNPNVADFSLEWADSDEAIGVLPGNLRPDLSADVNGDLSINDQDICFTVETILGTVLGDINFDGVLDAADLAAASPLGTLGAGYAGGDVDGDGEVTQIDLDIIAGDRNLCCPGDTNRDGLTDVSDFFALGGNFGTASGATRATGDLNGDGAVDVSDFFILGGDFGCPNN